MSIPTTDLIRLMAAGERAMSKAQRLRCDENTTPQIAAALRADVTGLIAAMTAALPQVPNGPMHDELERHLAPLRAHLGLPTPANG